MNNLGKQKGTSSILYQALCIISNPSVNSIWSHGPETLNSGQNRHFLSPVTLQFAGWPRKTIGHLSYAASSFVHHFKSIGEFKLELQSGKAQFGSNWQFFVPCDFEIWRMTLENNRATFLYCFKLCASLDSHWLIQTGVTVRKRPIWVKTDDFF